MFVSRDHGSGTTATRGKDDFCNFAIHGVSAAAYSGQDRNLTVLRERCVEQLLAPYIVVIQKNVYVLPQLPLLIQHAIAQANVPLPQTIERFTNSCRRRINSDLTLPVGKVGQETGD